MLKSSQLWINPDFRLISCIRGIDFSDISLNPLNIKVSGFDINSGVISMNVKKFSALDKSGFQIDQLHSRLKIFKKYMIFNFLDVLTARSDIHASKVHFLFADFKQFKGGIFGKKVKLDIDLEKSNVSSDDIAMFLPIVKDYHIKAL